MIDVSGIPGFTPSKEIGGGGQKHVILGKHAVHGDVVAKIVKNPDNVYRSKREVEILSELDSPRLSRVLEFGYIFHDGRNHLYTLEEFVPGRTLREVLQEWGKLDQTEAVFVVRSLLEVVAELEVKRIVHRDIKPENIMIRDGGTVVLIDFGIARDLTRDSLTATAAMFGPHTLGYSAPEQIRNLKAEIDSRADLFSVAIVGIECCTGENPLTKGAESSLEVLQRTETFVPSIPEIPWDMDRHLGSLLKVMASPYQSRRPPSAREALEWFDSLVGGGDLTAGRLV